MVKRCAFVLWVSLFVVVAPLVADDANSITITGEVTHIDVENEFFVVQSESVEILLICPATTNGCPCPPHNPCPSPSVGDEILVLAHFIGPVEVCGGANLPDNPIVIDYLALCIAGVCEKF